MLWLPKFSIIFYFLFLWYPNTQCHTVASSYESYADRDHLNLSQTGKLLSKREVIENAQNSSIAANKTDLVEASRNQTVHHLSNNTGGNLNSTWLAQSLPPWMSTINSGALERTGLVALGFMSIIIIFFVVRGLRLRHKRSKSRKYGVITSTDMEMEPLDKDDDEEEETTLFDAQHKYSLQ